MLMMLCIFTRSQLANLSNLVSTNIWFFQWSCMDVRVGLQRKLSTKELMLLNCGVGEDLESPLDCKRSNQPILKEISPEYSLEGLMLKLKLPIL